VWINDVVLRVIAVQSDSTVGLIPVAESPPRLPVPLNAKVSLLVLSAKDALSIVTLISLEYLVPGAP